MSAHFDATKLKQSKTNHYAPKLIWQWCVEHYGLIGALFALMGAFSSLLTIWFYLGEIDARDLFIPAMLDSKVWIFITFAYGQFLFVTVAVLIYAIFAAVLILERVPIESRLGSVTVKVVFLGVIALSIFSLAVLWVVGTSESLIEYAAAFVIYLGIVAPPVWYFHEKLWRKPLGWILWPISMFFLAIFLLLGGAEISKNVVQLAGIRQEANQACYYLVAKQLVPLFRDSSEWKMGAEGKSIAVCGYKIFQLSDISILCPADVALDAMQNIPPRAGYCVRLKSNELVLMPTYFIPESRKNAENCVTSNKTTPPPLSHKYSIAPVFSSA